MHTWFCRISAAVRSGEQAIQTKEGPRLDDPLALRYFLLQLLVTNQGFIYFKVILTLAQSKLKELQYNHL